jgi:ABC-type amino acid transport system permease subunit
MLIEEILVAMIGLVFAPVFFVVDGIAILAQRWQLSKKLTKFMATLP